MLRQCTERQPFPDYSLVAWMDVVGITCINGNGQAGIMDIASSPKLCLAQFCPGVFNRLIMMVHEGWKTDDIEGEIALAEQLPPICDHCGKQRAILISSVGGRFALIPDGACYCERGNRLYHSLIEDGRHGGPILEGQRQRVRWPRIDANGALPFARERDYRPIAENQTKPIGIGHESALRFRPEYANGHEIPARF